MSNEENILSEEDCKAALGTYLTGNDWKYKSHEVNHLNTTDGLIGAHYKVTIEYEDGNGSKSGNFFLKVLNSRTRPIFDIALSLNAHEKEDLLYKTFIPEYNARQIDTSYAPLCYLSRPYLILLEDMSLKGYRTSPKKDMLNIEHCKVALKALAHFHASAIVYEEIKTEERRSPYRISDTHSEYLGEKIFSETENAASIWFNCTVQGLLQVINLLPENKISSDEFKAKLLDELENVYQLQSENSGKFRNTVLHGDLWSNNFMFHYEGDKPVDSVLIDYQLLKYGPPASDVVQMIVTNVRRNLREQFYDDLLDSYYKNFVEYLNRHGLKPDAILSEADFLASCVEVKFSAKLQAAADHSITFMADDVLAKVFESEDQLEVFLFNDRSEGIITSYKTNDLYRELLEEDLIEIRDLLFPE